MLTSDIRFHIRMHYVFPQTFHSDAQGLRMAVYQMSPSHNLSFLDIFSILNVDWDLGQDRMRLAIHRLRLNFFSIFFLFGPRSSAIAKRKEGRERNKLQWMEGPNGRSASEIRRTGCHVPYFDLWLFFSIS